MNKVLIESTAGGMVETYEYSFSTLYFTAVQRCWYIYPGINVHMNGQFIETYENGHMIRWQPFVIIVFSNKIMGIQMLMQLGLGFAVHEIENKAAIPNITIQSLFESLNHANHSQNTEEMGISHDSDSEMY